MEQILKYFPDITEVQKRQFEQLKPLYEEWNAQINVISRKDMDSFYERHVVHSLAIAKVMAFQPGADVLDIGTGGGFPGIPLAILFPETKFHLVDSIGKKIKVVKAVAEALGLENVKATHARAEEIKDQYDFVVSRAVTRLNKFMPWIKGNHKKESIHDLPNGLLYLKGGDLGEELSEVKKHIKIYPIPEYYSEDFYETKAVIYVR
jgi:16S rRNA (guanine527-N7)-methyltransferase